MHVRIVEHAASRPPQAVPLRDRQGAQLAIAVPQAEQVEQAVAGMGVHGGKQLEPRLVGTQPAEGVAGPGRGCDQPRSSRAGERARARGEAWSARRAAWARRHRRRGGRRAQAPPAARPRGGIADRRRRGQTRLVADQIRERRSSSVGGERDEARPPARRRCLQPEVGHATVADRWPGRRAGRSSISSASARFSSIRPSGSQRSSAPSSARRMFARRSGEELREARSGYGSSFASAASVSRNAARMTPLSAARPVSPECRPSLPRPRRSRSPPGHGRSPPRRRPRTARRRRVETPSVGLVDPADPDHAEPVEFRGAQAPMLAAPNTCTPSLRANRISLCQQAGTARK